jgi:hypothetical protein
MEEELLTLPEYMSSLPVFSWIRVARSSVFCVMLCRTLIVHFPLASVLSVLRYTASDYLFGIYKFLLI